jgi:ribosomal protein S18 acetylase RimI-like enzyme
MGGVHERAMTQVHIRVAEPRDDDAICSILGPTIAAGETYPLPRDMSRSDALAYWKSPAHQVFVAEAQGRVAGTYYMRANQQGGGAHVANCGYITGEEARGRGVARAMCLHSLDHARAQGFLAMQFNFVVSSNTRAVALWQSLGFEVVGTLPQVFRHPALGLVDALVMYRKL